MTGSMKKTSLFIHSLLLIYQSLAFAEVNLRTGGLVDRIKLMTFTPKASFELVYRSRSLTQGHFGYGWCSDLEDSLNIDNTTQSAVVNNCLENKKITLHFSPQTKNWSRKFSELKRNYSLIPKKDNFEYFENDQWVKTFDRLGQLIKYKRGQTTFEVKRQDLRPKELSFNKQKVLFIWSQNKSHIESVRYQNKEIRLNQKNGLLTAIVNSKNILKFEYDESFNRTQKYENNQRTELTIYNQKTDQVISHFDAKKCLTNFTYRKVNDLRYKATSKKKCLNSLRQENIELIADYKTYLGVRKFKQFLVYKSITKKSENRLAQKEGETDEL
jgi:hypothetical protein